MKAACNNVQGPDWVDLDVRIRQNIAKAPTVVTLNVGGTTFQAFKDTLLRVKGSYFHALLGSGAWNPDGPGNAYFLDLDPDIFRHVFKFLRTGTVSMDRLTQSERRDLNSMMEYLALDASCGETILVHWDPAKHAPDMALSNGLRTVERLHTNYGKYKGAVVNSPLVGSLRLRVETIEHDVCIGVCPRSECNVASDFSNSHWHHLWSHGYLFEKKGRVASRLACLKAGDVVTLERTDSCVKFTLNKGPTCPIELDDAGEELYPFVFMTGRGTKLTILEAPES